ncbi:WXG100 family type VII secretion target [Nocardia macrotermitis]|uniref:ESAT-6-like protein n=1 Tax=Nocardia macrotermitis TaxID=2585198 RepID=A0A7K0D983_9NOCA|nr:WXG100 family type VII secretion target [Nocardia macrotermitis]MQY22287.1 hypothetical protein [Nocardia macrotermitis]
MGGELRVDPNRLWEASRFVSDQAAAMRAQLKQLDDTIGKRLLAEGWDSKAASAYEGSWTEWKQGADTVIAALDDSSAALITAANGYVAQDVSFHDGIAGSSLDLPEI